MKKTIIIIFILILIGLTFYSVNVFTGFKSPSNYNECIEFGGKTNIKEMRVQNTCVYNGKVFLGSII